MPRVIALEWDAREARVVVAATRGTGVALEQAFAIELAPAVAHGSESPAPTPAELGEKIARGMSERGIKRGPVLTAVPRSSVELKSLTLPPAPDEELPDLARFQGRREFHALSDDAVLDFIPLDSDPTKQRNILAAAITSESLAELKGVCLSALFPAERLVLRPAASASLLVRRLPGEAEQVRMLVDLQSEEVDLTVLVGARIVLTRTARLPKDLFASPESGRPLVSEIRRTIAAVANQLGGRRVESIALSGAGREFNELAAKIGSELQLASVVLDPFAGCELGSDAGNLRPELRGRFTPLVGMVLNELTPVEGARHDFDFLHPKRRPAPPSKKRPAMLGSIAAGVFVLAIGSWYWAESSYYDGEITRLRQESAQLTKTEQSLEKESKTAEALQGWQAGDVNWLDELAAISRDLPPAQDTLVTRMNISATATGGQILLQGAAQSRALVGKLEQNLRDDHRAVKSGGVREDLADKKYPQRFDSTLEMKREDKQYYEERLAAKKPEEKKADAKKEEAKKTAPPGKAELQAKSGG